MAGFSTWDWVVFTINLVASLGTGLLAGCIGKGKGGQDSKTKASEFLMGGRNLNPIAVALSTMIGSISSITIVGNAAEMYAYGTQLWMNIIGTFIGMVYVHLIILTVMYPLQITSVYTYIERRFKSKGLRTFTVFTTFIGTFFYLGLASYSPSLAMETVTGFPAWASIVIMGTICTIYSSWGGVRAVVYTDILQTFVMTGGVVFIMIHATIKAGGIDAVWDTARDHGRVEWWNLNPDPLQRHSFWLVTVQGYFFSLLVYGMGQPQVQRICSVNTWPKAIFSHYLNAAVVIALFCCINFMGLAVYAVYADCDPMATHAIEKPDQIVPHYVDEYLSYLQGIPGLFIASLYAGALSSYSSQINAVSAVMWEDFFKNSEWVANMADDRKPLVNVLVSVITGVAGILAGLIATQSTGIFQVGQTILGTIHAPLLGLFILGMCCPYANKIGGTVGFTTSLLFNLWVTIGTILYGKGTPPLDFSDEGCDAFTTPLNTTSTTLDPFTTAFTTAFTGSSTTDGGDPPEDGYVFPLYLVSYTLYSLFGVSVTFFVGAIVSLFTNPWSCDKVGEIYVHPTFFRVMRWWEAKYPPKDPAASTKNLVPLQKY